MADHRREIDWGAAEVTADATVLPLTGDAAKGWAERFETVVTLLGNGGSGAWGEVSLTKKAIKVTALAPGAEDDLRHFLESVIVQVNSELAPETGEQSDEPQDPQAARDAEMTEKLRTFSGQDDSNG
jgi:hypothetical protein